MADSPCQRVGEASPFAWTGENKLYRACLLAIALGYLALVYRFWFTTDDAYITFRYAKNLAEGHGPRFNLGPHTPIEGYSSFLWMVVCAGFELCGLAPVLWANLLSAGTGLILLAQVHQYLERRLRVSRSATLLGLAICAFHPPLAVYSSSGLETMAYTALLFACYAALVRDGEEIRPLSSGLLATGLGLIRVEGVFWVALFLALAVARNLSNRRLRRLEQAAWIFFLLYGTYWLWRFAYYGLPFPNTVYAKVGFSWDGLVRGWDYVLVQIMTQVNLWIALPGAFLLLHRRHRAAAGSLGIVVLGTYAYAVIVGGDFMAFGRFLLPAWPFTVVLGTWGLAQLQQRSQGLKRSAVPVAISATIVCGLLPSIDRYVVPVTLREKHHFRHKAHVFVDEHDQWERTRELTNHKARIGQALRLWSKSGDRLVHGSIGAISYYSGVFVLDRNGLVTAVDSEEAVGLGSPGHDRTVAHSYFLPEHPDILLPQLVPVLSPPDTPNRASREKTFKAAIGRIYHLLRREQLLDRFVLQMRPVHGTVPDEEARVLVWAQRIPEEDVPEFRRAEARAALESYVSSPAPAAFLAIRPEPLRRNVALLHGSK
jgi:hypothetical protein